MKNRLYNSGFRLILSCVAIVFCQVILQGQSRQKVSFNDGWEFSLDSSHWEEVRIPHTWNTADPFDDNPGYFRGTAHYQKSFSKNDSDQRTHLFFEAVNQISRLYVNDQFVGEHLGGYTAFCFDISDYIENGENRLYLQVNNAHDTCIAPLKGDFNFYGGIYRDVFLIQTSETHFDLSEGANGVFITPKVEGSSASLSIESRIRGDGRTKGYSVEHKVVDAAGKEVVTLGGELDNFRDATVNFSEVKMPAKPQLWSPDTPYCYRVLSSIKDRDGNIVDEVVNPLGFRSLHFDATNGFAINGDYIKLIGVNRHQDFPGIGNALSNDRHVRDVEIIKEMGCNFYRTAHYPQDPAVLQACDRLGMVVSMEIPLDHELTDDPCFYESSKTMMAEMIRQYYNHPSIALWAYMNEMYLWKDIRKDSAFVANVREFAIVLDSLTRAMDPGRYTMIPNHGYFDIYHEAGLLDIPQVVGWNLYYGWYVEGCENFGNFMDHFHKLHPEKPVIITEYGAGSDPRLHSLDPRRFDFSMEWQLDFHYCHLKQILDRKYIAGSAVWNMYDFGSESRNDAVPWINSKGLAEHDRSPKDGFYLYQANLSEKPVLEIGPIGWKKRKLLYQDRNVPVQLFTNAGLVHLAHNGRALGSKQTETGMAEYQVDLVQGRNRLKAVTLIDSQKVERELDWMVDFVDEPGKAFKEILGLNLGGNFYFYDELADDQWVPMPVKSEANWGSVGGAPWQPRDIGVGTDRAIKLTELDPLYQTAVEDLDSIMVALLPGLYLLEFHFAELNNKSGDRHMEISVGSQNLSIQVGLNQEDLFRAKMVSTEYYHEGGNLLIRLSASKGKTLLNSFRLIPL